MTSVQNLQKGEKVQITLHVDRYLNNALEKYAARTKRTKSGLACLVLEDWFRNATTNLERIENEMLEVPA